MNLYWGLGLLIAFIVYSGTIYHLADSAGATRIQAQQEKLINDAYAKGQAEGAKDSGAYQAENSQLKATIEQLKRSIPNVIAKTPSLAACNATPDFLQGYSSIIAH